MRNARSSFTQPMTIAAPSSFSAITLTLVLAGCAQTPAFDTPDASFKGRVSLTDTPLVVPGSEVKLAGQDFKPGQEVRLSYAGSPLGGAQPLVVSPDGSFRAQFSVPTTASAGQHPLVVSVAKPAAALVYPLKVSPDVPLSGQDRFALTSQKLVPGLYQAAYSARSDRVFVTAAAGRPPAIQSQLLKVNPQTLAVETAITPPPTPAVPARAGQPARDATIYPVYGVAVDDANGNVWVTNTRQDTVAVYRQSDLSLVKQFEPGTVAHSRDVVVDEILGKAYAAGTGKNQVVVFDTKTLQQVGTIELVTTVRGEDKKFAPMSLELDRQGHKLYTVSLGTDEAVAIDTRADKVEKVFPIVGSKTASGVAYDARTNRLLVASQGSDNLLIVDAATGRTLHDVKVGAGALNVAVDHQRGLAYVPNRGAGTITVVSLNGRIVANLPGGTFPNHVTEDGKGGIYAINKSRGANDAQGDRITHIVPR